MYTLSKRFLTFTALFIILLVAVAYIYVQLLLVQVEPKRTVNTGYSKEYECSDVVRTQSDAVLCFNSYFEGLDGEEVLMEEGSSTVGSEGIENVFHVSERDVFIYNNLYHIEREGYVSRYFIMDGSIMLKREY